MNIIKLWEKSMKDLEERKKRSEEGTPPVGVKPETPKTESRKPTTSSKP